jgi:hypothetical protein
LVLHQAVHVLLADFYPREWENSFRHFK